MTDFTVVTDHNRGIHGSNESTRSIGWVKIHVNESRRKHDEEDGLNHGFDAMVRYDDFVRMLLKPGTVEEQANHIGLGICGEAGEFADIIKRQWHYQSANMPDGKSFRESVIEELGDLRFYEQAAMNLYGISEQEVLNYNAKKLGERYAKLRYSNEAAAARADKRKDDPKEQLRAASVFPQDTSDPTP